MMTFKQGLAVAAVGLDLPVMAMSSANALPALSAPALSAAAATSDGNVTPVYWRGRGGGYRGGWGWGGVGAGVAAGALIGGAIAANSYPYGYGYGPGYYAAPAPGYVYAPAPAPAYGGDDDVAYCMQRYRSYDPRSGTYLNNDGNRYPCP